MSGGTRPEIVSNTACTVIDITRLWDTRLTHMDDPNPLDWGGFQWGPGTNADGSGPTVYLFSDNDVPNIRNNGAPEPKMEFRSSFDPEPHWLDDPTWYDDVTSEVKVQGPDPGEAGFQSVPDTNADRTTDDTRNTRAPEHTTNFRSDLDLEPHSLDGLTWDDGEGRSVMSGVKDGLRLDSTWQ